MIRFIVLAVVLVALIALPVYAQQSGLTLEGVSSRIDVLFTGQTYLTQRIAALETAVAISSQQQAVVLATPIPTATHLPLPTQTFTPIPTPTSEPTETPTREPSATPTRIPSITPTPTTASASVTADRRLSLRRAPGNSSIVAYIALNNQFEVIGKNLDGSWVHVNYNGQIGWLQASYAKGVSNLSIVSTPTPLPSPTSRPTRTPIPTATMEVLSQEAWDYMIEFTKRETIGLGRNPDNYTDEQYDEWTGTFVTKMREAAENCDMDFLDIAKIIDEEALLLEETGIPKRLDAGARWDFTQLLTEWWDETVESSCKRKIIGRRLWIVANYGDEE